MFAVIKNEWQKTSKPALIDLIEKEGNMSHEDAEAHLNDLKKQGRYLRDVY